MLDRGQIRRDVDMLRSANRNGETAMSRVEAFERLFKATPELLDELEEAEDAIACALETLRVWRYQRCLEPQTARLLYEVGAALTSPEQAAVPNHPTPTEGDDRG